MKWFTRKLELIKVFNLEENLSNLTTIQYTRSRFDEFIVEGIIYSQNDSITENHDLKKTSNFFSLTNLSYPSLIEHAQTQNPLYIFCRLLVNLSNVRVFQTLLSFLKKYDDFFYSVKVVKLVSTYTEKNHKWFCLSQFLLHTEKICHK